MKQIDVCVVAGRRPELLKATLESFDLNLFRNFSVGRFVVNIDPIFGTDADHRDCVEVVRSFSNSPTITSPAKAGFAAAVKRNWASTEADIVLHLEDDWLLQKPVTGHELDAFADQSIGQICFNHANKNWDAAKRGPFAYTRRPLRVLGIPTPFKTKFPVFTTSPCFLRGSFARDAARLMDVAFDPEKQFFKGVNPALEAHAASSKSKVIGGLDDYHVIDIGRAWRDTRNIQKAMVGWQSQWIEG